MKIYDGTLNLLRRVNNEGEIMVRLDNHLATNHVFRAAVLVTITVSLVTKVLPDCQGFRGKRFPRRMILPAECFENCGLWLTSWRTWNMIAD